MLAQTGAVKKRAGAKSSVREAFSLSRSLEFLSETELTKQIGYGRPLWPRAILKELLDNAADHCEEIGRLPEIWVTLTGTTLSVRDNGDGIREKVVKGMLDFDRRFSSREAFRAPCRGAQGNAGKCIVGIPYVLAGAKGRAVYEARGIRHEIAVKVDPLKQVPKPDHKKVQIEHSGNGKYPCTLNEDGTPKSTFCEVSLGEAPCTLAERGPFGFVLFCRKYAFLNPHITLHLNVEGGAKFTWERTADKCGKWTAANPEPPGWHDPESLKRLLVACIAKNEEDGTDQKVTAFLKEYFAGLKRSDAVKAVLSETRLHRANLSDLVTEEGISDELVGKLLKSMQEHGKTPQPEKLGCIGKRHIAERVSELGADPSEMKYKKEVGKDSRGLPFVVEAAFVETEYDRLVVTGCNYSPSIELPVVRSLDGLLEHQMIEDEAMVVILLHVSTVAPIYLDRGKSVINPHNALAAAIEKCLKSVTNEYRRLRKQEERDAAAQYRRQLQRRQSGPKCSLKDAIRLVLEDAVDDASEGGTCEFSDRDLYYAVRPRIQEYNTNNLTQKWFDNVVDAWEEEHGLIPGRHRDPRGFLLEPHTGRKVPLGTKAVDDYEIPGHLYDTILYFEKKGVLPKLQHGKIAERYDCAIIAAEGYAPRAAKALIHAAQGGHKMKVLCFHDSDPYGYNIFRTLSLDTGAHRYAIEVIDAGLNLKEALDMELATETFTRKNALPSGLKLTDLEHEYFTGDQVRVGETKSGKPKYHYVGCRRVELNALSVDTPAFLSWVEAKLSEHGVAKKLVPPKREIAAHAREQRRAMLATQIRQRVEQQLDIGSLVDAAVRSLVTAVDIDGVADDVAAWSKELKPERWTQCINNLLAKAITAADPQIREKIAKLLKGLGS